MINELWLLGMHQLSFKPSYQHLPMAVADVNLFRRNYLAKRPVHNPDSSSTKPYYWNRLSMQFIIVSLKYAKSSLKSIIWMEHMLL